MPTIALDARGGDHAPEAVVMHLERRLTRKLFSVLTARHVYGLGYFFWKHGYGPIDAFDPLALTLPIQMVVDQLRERSACKSCFQL